jgi:iron complex transport system substrate-binding protein
VLVKPCGFSIARTMEERALVERIAAAAPGARVCVSDGNAYFNRPGPRLVESLENLAACVHPERFGDFAGKHAAYIVRL